MYFVLNVFLWIIWAVSGTGFPWPIFVTVGWGIGIVMQGWYVYRGAAPITEAEIQREMGKGTGSHMSPDTTTAPAPVLAPVQAPVDTPVETPSRPVTDDGDHDRFAHYARKDDVARAYVTGEAIVALCGKKWIPTRDPKNYPVCPTCKERKAAGWSI